MLLVGLVALVIGVALGYFVRHTQARSQKTEFDAEVQRIQATTET